MEIIKLIGVALVCAIIILYLRNTKPELAFAAAVASAVIMLIMIVGMLAEVIVFFTEINEKTGIDSEIIKTVLKIVGVGYLIEFAAGLIEDFGSKALSDKLILGGKIVILVMALPIIKSMLLLIVSLLE